jgi:hypothetical protein
MGRAIKKETIKNFCSKILSDGFTSLDLKSDWECRPYPITCRYKLSCDDGTQQEIELVYGEWDGKQAVLLWSFIEDKYVEDLIRYFGDDETWWDSLLSDDVEKRAYAVIENIIRGGQKNLQKRINTEGINNVHSLVLTENHLQEAIKLPYSCAISFYGEVIAGVEEIEKYCKNQKESSSPYILKRFYDISHVNDETRKNETIRCTNYLICKDSKIAKSWIKEFVGMGCFSVYSDYIPEARNRPPMICYAEGERYMLLDYKEGGRRRL